MNKSGLVAEIAKRTDRGKSEVARTVEAAIAVIRETVAKGERVALVGFGTFERTRRNKRVARNPKRPSVPIAVPARDVPTFSPGQEFKRAVAAKQRRSRARPSGSRSAKR